MDIYYFSGTGNSLAIARDITEKADGRLISIASVMDKKSIKTNADIIGIVFPVYFVFNGGIPLIIEEFVRKMEDIGSKYIFVVCTYGSFGGAAIDNINNIIISCGGKLSAGFLVRMPYNYTDWSGQIAAISLEKQEKMFNDWKKKLDMIYGYVYSRKEGRLEACNVLVRFFLRIMKKIGKSHYQVKAGLSKHDDTPFAEIMPLMDRSFHASEKCNGCGICLKVCPVNNIKLVDCKPSWNNHCEQCFACLHWCPGEAIQFGGNTADSKRYHHPDVNLADMIN
jgi:ferredoxin